MARPKIFDPESFTIYNLSVVLRLKYSKARRVLLNMIQHKIVRKVEHTGDRRQRRYQII